MFHCTHSNGICHTGLLTACEQGQDGTAVPSWSYSQAVSKPVWHIPLLCVQWNTPDDVQRNCTKHVEFYSKNKFEKLMHLVDFIMRIYHDTRSPERQIANWYFCFQQTKCSQSRNVQSFKDFQKSSRIYRLCPARPVLWGWMHGDKSHHSRRGIQYTKGRRFDCNREIKKQVRLKTGSTSCYHRCLKYRKQVISEDADPSGRAVEGVVLRPLTCWD